MGRTTVELRASGLLSRHNSPQDDTDNAIWNEFVGAVKAAAAKADGDGHIYIDVMADGDLPTDQWGEDDE